MSKHFGKTQVQIYVEQIGAAYDQRSASGMSEDSCFDAAMQDARDLIEWRKLPENMANALLTYVENGEF